MHSAPTMATAVRMYQRMGFRRLPEHDFTPRPDARLRVLAFGLALDGLSP
jgi:hypothetical protein